MKVTTRLNAGLALKVAMAIRGEAHECIGLGIGRDSALEMAGDIASEINELHCLFFKGAAYDRLVSEVQDEIRKAYDA